MAGNSINVQNNAKKSGIVKFFKGMKAEIKIITWPSKKETKKALIAVAVVTLIYVIWVGGFDYIFQNLFEAILKLK
ncbi:preprotein translocase subunit SecE [Clostridium vincentii]|uniref:Protein translocase subunit SecE n=1 Tax=Clostridium vincentii TaxID=52704 RepID=A0A2T0B7I4_9CLOT|nr:preprotein translocase subunit SecE [Clostridium vincentii]PRR79815.1 preprotein translocase subunit SecE [Clostridium vincentii]